MRKLMILGAAASSIVLAACGSDSSTPNGFPKPAGTIAASIAIDDTANKVFLDGELQWKGAMIYDASTRKITADSTWGGPWAALYDDGPYTAGGHEGADGVAGDHIFGAAVFVTPPATGSATYEYGLIDHKFGDGWLWVGSNGTFAVAAGATADVKATGLSLAKFGTTDMQLVVDTNNLLAGVTWDTTKVTVKGSAWAWNEIQLKDDGTKGDAAASDKKFTFTLSEYAGAGKTYYHTGLTNSGDKPQFIFVFNGKEYKDPAASAAAITGVTAGIKASGASAFTNAPVLLQTTGDKNSYINIP